MHPNLGFAVTPWFDVDRETILARVLQPEKDILSWD